MTTPASLREATCRRTPARPAAPYAPPECHVLSDTLAPTGGIRFGPEKIPFALPARAVERRAPAFMDHVPLPTLTLAGVLAFLAPAHAQSTLPPEPISLETAAAFRPLTANWQLASDLGGDPRRDPKLTPIAGTGILVCNPGQEREKRGQLFTTWEHGDLEVDLEFLMSPKSNSGVYLQGRYEVQLFDSWGVKEPKYSDCGGIYQRWDASRGKGNEGYEGIAPRANACRAPGLWQKLHIEFEAARFDASGKKTRNARFRRVVLNDFVVQENVEVTGPTRSSAFNDEKPLGPLMIQGDHGPVELRRIAVKRFEAGLRLTTENLQYRLYEGDHKQPGDYDALKPTRAGTPARLGLSAVEASGKLALVFTGQLVAPRSGNYRFALTSLSTTRLQIDGQTVATPAVIALTAGRHDFRLDLVHGTNARPMLAWQAEGPGIAPHALTASDETGGGGRGRRGNRANVAGKALPLEPKDRVILQRGFVPFEPRKRLYAASVGSPVGVHFAYDFETGSILRAWRGSFVDAVQMWEGRGNDQTAQPTGPALTFDGKPTLGLIERASTGDWPDRPEPLWTSQGYELEPDGTPVFLGSLAEITVRDRVSANAQGLERTLTLQGKLPSWSAWVLLAEAESITPQPGGQGWVVGNREWYVDWPSSASHRPVIRSVNGRQQLAVPLTASNLQKPIRYAVIW